MPDSKSSAFDPVAEQLLADARAREAHTLTRAERLTYWTSSLGFILAAAALLAFGRHGALPQTWVVVLLVVTYAVASRLEFEVGSAVAIATELVLVEMLFLLPPAQLPLWVALGGLLGQVPEYALGIVPVERMLVVIGSSWYALGPALVFELAGAPAATTSLHTQLLLAAAVAAQFAVDLTSSAARERMALGVPVRQLGSLVSLVFVIDLVLAPLGLLAAIGAREGQAALILPLPLLFVIGLSTRERQRRNDQSLELSSAYRGTAFLLGDVVEADDAYTGAHSRDVLDLVLAVCDRLKVDARSRVNAEFTALLHDVGKIRIPPEIINKPGPLDPEERATMALHTIEGQRLLQRVGGRLAEVGAIVRSCHEDWDGTGYPDGLAGDEIPLVARIVSCCDAFSAMTTNRPYRQAMTTAEALAELERCRGTQFDPRVVDTLLELIRGGAIGHERRAELVHVRA